MSKLIALIIALFISMGSASAMSFSWLDPSMVLASGSIQAGDVAKFAQKRGAQFWIPSPPGFPQRERT
jgi:hypothetical protein